MNLTALRAGIWASLAVLVVGCSGADGQHQEQRCADLDAGDQCRAAEGCDDFQVLPYSLSDYDQHYGDDDPDQARPCPDALASTSVPRCVDEGWPDQAANSENEEPTNVARQTGGSWQIYRLDDDFQKAEDNGFVDCSEVYAQQGPSTAWEVCAYCRPHSSDR